MLLSSVVESQLTGNNDDDYFLFVGMTAYLWSEVCGFILYSSSATNNWTVTVKQRVPSLMLFGQKVQLPPCNGEVSAESSKCYVVTHFFGCHGHACRWQQSGVQKGLFYTYGRPPLPESGRHRPRLPLDCHCMTSTFREKSSGRRKFNIFS